MLADPFHPGWKAPDRESWTVAIGIALGLLSGGVGPWITGGLIDTGQFDVQQAALMVTAEQMAMGAVMLALTGMMHRLPRRTLLALGVGLVLLTQAISFLINGFTLMIVSRMLSGVGFAFIYSLSMALGASTRDPDRTFAVGQGMTQVVAMALNPMLGFGAQIPGHKGVFAVLGAYSLLLSIPLMLLMLRRTPVSAEHARRRTLTVPIRSKAVIGVLTVMTIFSVATGATWNFMERVALGVGLAGPTLGTGLVVSSLIGTLGSVLANRLGTSFGRIGPLCGGLVALGLCTVWFMIPGSALYFWMAVSLWAFLLTFVTPYVFGLAAAADPSGRVVAATGTAYIIVSAAGVYVGAFTAKHFGMTLFSIAALIMLVITALIAAVVSRMVGRLCPAEFGRRSRSR